MSVFTADPVLLVPCVRREMLAAAAWASLLKQLCARHLNWTLPGWQLRWLYSSEACKKIINTCALVILKMQRTENLMAKSSLLSNCLRKVTLSLYL